MASVASIASIADGNSLALQSFRKRKWQHLLPLRLLFFFFFKKKKLFLFAVIPNSLIFAPDFLK